MSVIQLQTQLPKKVSEDWINEKTICVSNSIGTFNCLMCYSQEQSGKRAKRPASEYLDIDHLEKAVCEEFNETFEAVTRNSSLTEMVKEQVNSLILEQVKMNSQTASINLMKIDRNSIKFYQPTIEKPSHKLE